MYLSTVQWVSSIQNRVSSRPLSLVSLLNYPFSVFIQPFFYLPFLHVSTGPRTYSSAALTSVFTVAATSGLDCLSSLCSIVCLKTLMVLIWSW
jgi:hypothetical protein